MSEHWYVFLVGRHIEPEVLVAEYSDTVANWGVIGVSLTRDGALALAAAGDFLMTLPLDEPSQSVLGESYKVEWVTEDGDLS